MNPHWQPIPSITNTPELLAGRFELTFLRHGDRTTLGRQFVSYPFHLTRPFTLDAAIPSLLTVYQQSSSGGMYRDERLSCRFNVTKGAAAHITTQAATIVHDCHGQPACQTTSIMVEPAAFLAVTPDPLVLFPGAFYVSRIEARLDRNAALLLSDAFAYHDPQHIDRPFAQLHSDIVVRDSDGRLLTRDCFKIDGASLSGPASPTGDWRVVQSFLLLGDQSRLPTHDDLLAAVGKTERSATGVSALPNDAGWGVRSLAADAVAARHVAELLFTATVQAAFRCAPAPRRK